VKIPPLLVLIVMVALLLPGITGAQGHRASVKVPSGMDIDGLGMDARRALNAWELAAQSPLPSEWTMLSLAPGETVRVARDVFVLVVESNGDTPKLLVVGPEGPQDVVLTRGEPVAVGPIEVLMTNHMPALHRTEVLVRGAGSASQLFADSAGTIVSSTRISAVDGQPARMIVEGTDERSVMFVKAYLEERLRGQSREGAAVQARRDVPPRPDGAIEVGGIVGRATTLDGLYRDPVNMRLPPDFDAAGYHTAIVTLNLVQGSSDALRELSTSGSYDSAGRASPNPRVRARTEGSGATTVRVGERGDRFQGQLRALERSGSVRVESSAFLRVPLDGLGASSFAFGDQQSGQSGALRARRVGSDMVELIVDSQSGDWSSIGAVSTRVRVRDGSTVPLARSATTITRESRSGPPLIGDIPYAGPLIGSSSRSSHQSDYALFATVVME
jgi:hypothetical protein